MQKINPFMFGSFAFLFACTNNSPVVGEWEITDYNAPNYYDVLDEDAQTSLPQEINTLYDGESYTPPMVIESGLLLIPPFSDSENLSTGLLSLNLSTTCGTIQADFEVIFERKSAFYAELDQYNPQTILPTQSDCFINTDEEDTYDSDPNHWPTIKTTTEEAIIRSLNKSDSSNEGCYTSLNAGLQCINFSLEKK